MKINSDVLTTIFGLVLAAIVAAAVDWTKVLAGDRVELAKIVGAFVVAANGYFINKASKANQ